MIAKIVPPKVHGGGMTSYWIEDFHLIKLLSIAIDLRSPLVWYNLTGIHNSNQPCIEGLKLSPNSLNIIHEHLIKIRRYYYLFYWYHEWTTGTVRWVMRFADNVVITILNSKLNIPISNESYRVCFLQIKISKMTGIKNLGSLALSRWISLNTCGSRGFESQADFWAISTPN